MTPTRNLWADRQDAVWRLNHAAKLGGCTTSDLLKTKARRPIINALISDSFTRDYLGMRQHSMRHRWSELVDYSADKTMAIGFVEINEGIRGLADDLMTSYSTLSRNLTLWRTQTPPLVRIATSTPDNNQEQFVLLQVPLMTQWLLWVAEQRANYFARVPNAMNLKQISELAQQMIEHNLQPIPKSNDSSKEQRRMLHRLKRNINFS